MTIDIIVTKTLHLERTSEADSVPAIWACAEIQRQLNTLTPDQRQTAMLQGWTHARIDYQYERDQLEVAQARMLALVSDLRQQAAKGHVTRDEFEAALAAVGL